VTAETRQQQPTRTRRHIIDEIDEPIRTPVQDSNPNAAGAAGLKGDMGVSSERAGPFGSEDSEGEDSQREDSQGEDSQGEDIEGTGSVGSSAAATDGTVSSSGAEDAVGEQPGEQPGEQDEEADMARANAGVPHHDFDPTKSPGHSHS